MKKLLFLVFILLTFNAISQNTFSIKGKVTDNNQTPLVGASIIIHELQKGTLADKDGNFVFDAIPSGEYHLHISFLGYKCVHYNVVKIIDKDTLCRFAMQPDNVNIDEVVVQANSNKQQKQEKTLSVELINTDFIQQNLNSNLMKSIERLPGISSIDVGQGFSKPVIRGLSFNRVAVTENGVKQEGQQWGADHGLEIDQFGIENIEIIKGPASLIYGSDAIGGVIQINPNNIAEKRTIEARIETVYKSINNFIGGSFMLKQRHEDWYFNFRYTQTNFGDYKVPADSFFYNSYRLPIYNQSLKNTAGNEKDVFLAIGVLKSQYKNTLTLSNVNSTNGFFPGSHGIPSANILIDDGDKRNIGLPYQMVNHLKIINNAKIYLDKGSIDFTVGFQNNFRQEWSLFHTHYPNQEAPETNPNLELELRLNSLSSDIKYKYLSENNKFETGFSAQHQLNGINGYIFLLPEYKRNSLGYFIFDTYKISSKLILSTGLRFDYGQTDVTEFYSIYAHDYKSINFTAKFYDVSWALGVSYNFTENLNAKANIGKSFRMPNVAELSANGIHHGSFRYEVGNNAITSEYSYQLDAGLFYSSEKLQLELNGFVNYFPNFIYLSPTGSYLHPNGSEIAEADAGQVYQYLQSEAFRAGGEMSIIYKPTENIRVTTSAEYIYASDFKYPIPFTPPLTIYSEVLYQMKDLANVLKNTNLNINASFTSSQNRVARNELKTSSYSVYNFSFATDVKISKININFAVQMQNLLNTKYFNHLSFYRLIELPEPGRNIQIMLKIPLIKAY